MSITINSNVAASHSSLNMKRANNLLTKSLQRLSSGKRIVSPSDDAGGLAVGMKLQSSLRRAAASRMNTQNGISFLQMQDGVMKVAGEILDRMSELKSFYNDISKNATDRETYNHEFHELQKELNSLKAQKLNGVSLFASTEGNGTLGISTSDDGIGDKIELKRTGFFENLKSKFGADSVLNSGAQGSYRQLVGDFSRDGGVNDPQPGSTSRAYASGQVVYKTGISDTDSGYFMATKDVSPGVLITEGGANTNWIRIADKSGNGFVEAFPEAEEFDPFSLKRTSDGRQMSYLQGDVVKVPAHWDSPGSYFYLKAQSDVPYGKTLNGIFNENQVGPGKFFDYVGQNSSGIPTTDFVRANADLPDPSLFNPTNNSSFINLFTAHQSNAYTPGHVKVDAANDPFLNGTSSNAVSSSPIKKIQVIDSIQGDAQEKIMTVDIDNGNASDSYKLAITVAGMTREVSAQFAATGGSNNQVATNLKAAIDAHPDLSKYIDTTGSATNRLLLTGKAGAGDFTITRTDLDNRAPYTTFDRSTPLAAGTVVTGGISLGTNVHVLAGDFLGTIDVSIAGGNYNAGDVIFHKGEFYAAQPGVTNATSIFSTPGNLSTANWGSPLNTATAIYGNQIPTGEIASSSEATTQAYLADTFTVSLNGFITPVTVGPIDHAIAGGDAQNATASLIKAAIEADPLANSLVTVSINSTNGVEITSRASGVNFTTNVTHSNNLSTPGNASASADVNTTVSISSAVVSSIASGASGAYGVYVPAANWGIQQWDPTSPFQAGDRVIDSTNNAIFEMNSNVKGGFVGQATNAGDLVLYAGQWWEATTSNLGTDTPGISGNWNQGVDPLTSIGSTNKNSEFMDLTNQSIWTRTHHGELVGKTISMNYNRGDNIFYQGKHYIYTSSIPSNDIIYNPDGDGYTEFEDLLSAGAMVEAPIYIDTRGGGGSATGNPDIFYRPNQDLEFVDRLPNSGIARTNSIERRSDSARFPGDEIFNSRDDQYYGGLNAGNDGIYGTADDFYSTTSSPDTARAGGHVDSDADNNKDLLDTANGLENFSVADFVDYIQTLANMRAINGGTMSRLNYATNILEENEINLGSATSRIMDADMAQESTMMARQNVLLQASASMITQANQLSSIVLSLLQ